MAGGGRGGRIDTKEEPLSAAAELGTVTSALVFPLC
jgi:hypothetical protein